jgi:hypothetical protein
MFIPLNVVYFYLNIIGSRVLSDPGLFNSTVQVTAAINIAQQPRIQKVPTSNQTAGSDGKFKEVNTTSVSIRT